MRGGSEAHPVVGFVPEDVGPMVTLHAHWYADNGYETAVFPTEQEAVAFARRRWRREPIVMRPAADKETPDAH